MTNKLLIVVSFLTYSLFLSPVLASSQLNQNSEIDEFELFEEIDVQKSKNSVKKVQNTKPLNNQKDLLAAQKLVQENKIQEATRLLWKKIGDLNNESIFYLADLHKELHEPEDAIKALSLVLAKDEKNFIALTKIGESQLQLPKKEKEAMESFKSALEINAKHEAAYIGLIRIYEKKKNLYELRIIYQDMIKNIGSKALYSEKLCEINTKDQIYEPAIRDCKLAIRLNDKACDSYVYLGMAYKYIGDETLGIENLVRATTKCPKNDFALLTYGKHLEEKKNYLEANKFYFQCTQSNTNNGLCWLGLAKSSFELKNNEQSVEAYKKACKLVREQAAASLRKSIQFFRSSKSIKDGEKYEAILEQCSL